MTIKATTKPRDEAQAAGYKAFNNGEHLCVDLPNKWTTISVRLASGKRITFAFIPSPGNTDIQCIDIEAEGEEIEIEGRKCFKQKLIGFHTGRNSFNTDDMELDTSMFTVLLK